MRPVSANESDAIDEESSDFPYDVRLARRWKRRGVANKSFKLDCSGHGGPKQTLNNNNGVCKEEFVEFKLNSCSNRVPKKTIKDDNDDVVVEGDETDAETIIKDDNDDVVMEGDEPDADYERFLNVVLSYGDGDGDADPQYMMFLGKLKADGTSYVLEVPLNDEMSMFVKYEKEDGSCDGNKAEDLGGMENCPMSDNTKSQRILRSASRKESMGTEKKLSDVRSKKRTSPMVEKKVKAADPVSTNERTIKRPRPENVHSAKHKCNRRMKCDMVDKSYQEFLGCLKNDGNYLVYMPPGGKQVIYEEDVENASDIEVIAMDDDPFSSGNYKPFVASKSFMAEEPGTGSSLSQFRKELMDILKKPYDKKEYDDLWEEVSRRRPKKRHLDLRGERGISCSLQSPGKSYLDYHKDLKAKIDLAGRDHSKILKRRKILNILRGFIYWLQNSPMQGAFHPWKDPLCLEVLPQSN